MKKGDLIFEEGQTIISGGIKWWTHSQFSHVAVVTDVTERPVIIEATWPVVREVLLSDSMDGDKYIVMTPKVPLTQIEADNLIAFLRTKIGKHYDALGLFSFVIHADISNKSWFWCSEFVEEGFASINRPILRLAANWTTPQDLYQSLEIIPDVV